MEDFLYVDARTQDADANYRLITGCVVPRPVAWITTVDEAGCVNAAPFSSYNFVCTDPPMVGVNISLRGGEPKDTARNIRANGEFVVNVATEANLDLMHACSQEFGPDESEARALGIDLLPSRSVRPPRIAVAPVQMECRLVQAVTLGRVGSTLYIGEVLAFHLSPAVMDGQRVDSTRLCPVARLGGPWYALLGETLNRPILQRSRG